MTAPQVSWLRHSVAGHSVGFSVNKLSIGKVTAGVFSPWKAISLKVQTNNTRHTKVWLNDSSALCRGVAVSLGLTAARWHFRYTVTNLVSEWSTIATARAGMANKTLATPFYAGINSAGVGVSMGRDANGTVTAGGPIGHSRVLFLSIRPATLALDGEHTDFTAMASYDFS